MRLELLWFDDVKQIHTPHNDFKHRVRDSMQQDGLLCPMVVDWNNDDSVPNLKTCKERCDISGEVTHDALEDAWDVIQILRTKY
jgi:hypothetical protein